MIPECQNRDGVKALTDSFLLHQGLVTARLFLNPELKNTETSAAFEEAFARELSVVLPNFKQKGLAYQIYMLRQGSEKDKATFGPSNSK